MTTVRVVASPKEILLTMLSQFEDISIDGDTKIAFTENVEQRFLSYGWQVLHVDDGDTWVSEKFIVWASLT